MPNFSRSILVVEDYAIIRMGIVDLLSEAGFDVLEAESAEEAIGILEARADIRLVFTDIKMPGSMDGLKLSHYIRGRWPPVKLVLSSGNIIVDEDQLPEGAQFFAKPYDGAHVVQAIIGMLPVVNQRQ